MKTKIAVGLLAALGMGNAIADCASLPDFDDLITALQAIVAAGGNGGLGNEMWATIVDRSGEVCVVARSANAGFGNQWPGSRIISAQKANTANAFSLPSNVGRGFQAPLSTANLFAAVQPGGSFFGLQESNPVNTAVAYTGNALFWGTFLDPLEGERIGGVNVFGGGVALYDENGVLLGGLGVSGDTSCTDHIIAWKIRDSLELDYLPGGVADGTDNIIFDITGSHGNFQSKSGFGHPECGFGETPIAEALPSTHPISVP